jgi:hypothetical protein
MWFSFFGVDFVFLFFGNLLKALFSAFFGVKYFLWCLQSLDSSLFGNIKNGSTRAFWVVTLFTKKTAKGTPFYLRYICFFAGFKMIYLFLLISFEVL